MLGHWLAGEQLADTRLLLSQPGRYPGGLAGVVDAAGDNHPQHRAGEQGEDSGVTRNRAMAILQI